MSSTPPAAYIAVDDRTFSATTLTRGPWSPGHQHAGPPSALAVRAIERAAAQAGLGHVGRLTGNLLRPVPIGTLEVEVVPRYVGRSTGHYEARIIAGGKEVAIYTALVQREDELPVPEGTPGHPLPQAAKSPADSTPVRMFGRADIGYGELVENRVGAGRFFGGPCLAWFRLRYPLVEGESASPYQRVAVAADSGNGVSAALDISTWMFVNGDLTINWLRRPLGEWVALDARTALGGNGCGLAESALYDEAGLIGRATQTLTVRRR